MGLAEAPRLRADGFAGEVPRVRKEREEEGSLRAVV